MTLEYFGSLLARSYKAILLNLNDAYTVLIKANSIAVIGTEVETDHFYLNKQIIK